MTQYTKYKSIRNIIYTLEDFNPVDRKILIRCKRKSIAFDISIDSVFELKAILLSLNSNDSSTIGYLFGVYGNRNREIRSIFSFNEKPNSKYILMYENRGSILGVKNNVNGVIFLKKPEELLRNKKEINNFDSLQAFYIGFLAGNKVGSRKLKRYLECDYSENILKFRSRN